MACTWLGAMRIRKYDKNGKTHSNILPTWCLKILLRLVHTNAAHWTVLYVLNLFAIIHIFSRMAILPTDQRSKIMDQTNASLGQREKCVVIKDVKVKAVKLSYTLY